MKVCGVVSIAVLLGCITVLDAYPSVPFQPPLNYQNMYYGRPQSIRQDALSTFIPQSQKSEPSEFRRVLLYLDDIMSVRSLTLPSPLKSLSGASQLYSSYTGEPQSDPLRGLSAAFDVMNLSNSNPIIAVLAASSLFLSFTKT